MREINETVAYRTDLANCYVPLGLRSVGRATFRPGQSSVSRKTSFLHILWTVQGEGCARIAGKALRLPRGWAVACPPEEGHLLSASRAESWEYRWCTMDGPLASVLPSAFKLPKEPFRAGECPEELFERLAESLSDVSAEGERMASAEAYRFLALLAGKVQARRKESSRRKGGWLLSNVSFDLASRDASVKSVAEETGLSRFSVNRIFKEELGVAPKRYFDSLRLQKALALLRESSASIEEVAQATGFANANYFAKFFRKKTGLPPSQFREGKHLP